MADEKPPIEGEANSAMIATDPPEEERRSLPIPPEVLEGLPDDKKRELTAVFAAMQYSGPMPNPIAAKITPKHIDVILETQKEANSLRYKDKHESRQVAAQVFTFSSVLVVIVVLGLALSGHDATLSTLVPLAVAGAGGFGGGFGFAEIRRRDDD